MIEEDPQVEPQDDGEAARDESSFAQWLAEIWDDEVEPLFARRHWEFALQHVSLPPRAQVLVAGCSTGAIIPALLRQMSSGDQGRIIALEARGPLLQKARSRVEDYDRRRVFLRGESIRKLRFAANVFDVVLSSLSWLELPEPGVALQEFFRVLRPGGKVVLALPLRGTLQEVYDLFAEVTLKFELPEVHRDLDEHMKQCHPEPEAARGLLEGVGFRDVRASSQEHEMPFPPGEDFFASVPIKALFEEKWRAAAGDHADVLFRQTQSAIDTYFGSEAFHVRLVVGCLEGTKPSQGIAAR